MGPSIQITDRLVLKVETEARAGEVLSMYLRNRLIFDPFEPTRPANFYTQDYHAAILRREYKAYMSDTFLRYYIYKASNSSRIIGSVNFNILIEPLSKMRYAEIGYKLDGLYHGRGLACEACMAGIRVMISDYGIRRIDARIHPSNTSSIKLAERMGFVPLSYEPKSANIMGRYEDIVRYTLDTSHIQ